ncbi:MAG: hypothetical protein ABIR79_02355 [Candidatus Binatia bacterium]
MRKVERERDESPDHAIEPQPLAPEARRRRNGPLTAIALCAVLGFAGGAVLSWWTPAEEPAVEVAALPVPPPPPAIAVPRAPVAEPPVPVAAAPAAAPEPIPNIAAAPTGSEPAAPESRAVVAVEKPALQPAAAISARAIPDGHVEQKGAIASLGKDGTALEPSPFAAQRSAARDAAPAPAPAVQMPAGSNPADLETNRAARELAAIAPSEPAIPDPAPLDVAPEAEAEPEPETPAETLVDTGRSPPGAPKVALSFLQWSADPARRFAFISIDGQPSQRVREGESTAGMTVAAITPTGVQFKREGTSFVIRPRH